jgi:hypothetical protein
VEGSWQVSLTAAMSGRDVQITATMVDPSRKTENALKPVTFPASAVGLEGLPRTCAGGIAQKRGPDGLTVTWHMPSSTVCAGDVMRPELEVNKGSRVQVWSVSPDGSAILLVPGDDGKGGRLNGNWTGRVALPEMVAVPSSVPGDEMLVAVAVPSSAPVAASAPDRLCRVEKLDGARLPAGAAVGVLSWKVKRDPVSCAMAPKAEAMVAEGERLIASLPSCP